MIVNSEHPLLLIRQQSMNDSSEVTESNEVMNEKSMAELQLEDPDIGPILQLRLQCSDQDPPEDVLAEPEAAKVLRGQWHNLRIRDGTLYQELIGKYGRPTVLQLVIPRIRKIEFIRSCHEGMTGGHRAVRSTLDQVQRRGFWYGWRRDVQRFCRQCQNCASYHRGRLPRSGPLQPMITGSVLERCHVDITGPHPRTPRGSQYILTCVDAFSKWAEAFVIPNKEAKTVARVLVEQVFCRLGTPLALLTDNAGELDGNLMQEICRLLDIDKQRTSFYHPETNSVAERFHGTLNAMMGRMISETQRDWDLLLPYVMAAYRSSVHRSTGYTPNYLMFAREVKSPTDLVYGTSIDPPPKSYDDYSVAMEDRMKQAYDLVRRELGVAAERMKRQYDIRVRPMKYHRGDWVLYFSPRNIQGRQQKWQRKYSPYLVIKEYPPVNYLIQKSSRSKPIIAHVDKLKTWTTDHPPNSWLRPDDPQADSEVSTGVINNGQDRPAGDDRDVMMNPVGDPEEELMTSTGADVNSGWRKEVGSPSLRSPRSGADVLFRQREGALATPSLCSLREPSRCDPVVVNEHIAAIDGDVTGDDAINGGQLGRAPDHGDGIVTPGVSNVIDGMVTDCGHRQGHINETSPGVIDDGVGPGYCIPGRDNGQSGRVDGDETVNLGDGVVDGQAPTGSRLPLESRRDTRTLNDGDWPRRYTFGRGDGRRGPGGIPLGRSDVNTRGRRRATSEYRAVEPSSSLTPDGQFSDIVDAAGIAGDPESVQRRRSQPQRTGRIPDRYKDFVMNRSAWHGSIIPFQHENFNDSPRSVQCRRDYQS